ncbi:MAG: HAD family hydrolase [Anaerolineales bacterium]|nr:HAD family hydrolase [Anaerolineales bacterium]
MMNMETLEKIRLELHNYSISDYFRNLKNIKDNVNLLKNKAIRIAILRSYTAEMIEPILKLRLILEGYNPEFFWGDFNQYAQEILDDSSALYEFKPDLILIMIRVEEFIPYFVWDFETKTDAEWINEVQDAAKHMISLVNTLNDRIPAQVIVQNMSLSSVPYWGIYDAQRSNSQTNLLNDFNNQLSEAFEENTNTYIWDFNNFVMRKGSDTIFDPKLWYVSRNPFKQSAYLEIANDLSRYILSVLGKVIKCIVLDLDNTLWGGVIGEDGMEGIALGQDYPGNCYVDFQRELLKLYHRGIILAINSKNNESDAFEVIDNHPYMILRRKHFAAYQINWNDKVSNLNVLAKEINIGVDSMIMIDDNPGECELIRQLCPECTVAQFPEKPYRVSDLIRSLPGIENIRLTDEDKKKGEIYQAQVKRKKLETSSSDLGEFFRALEMKAEIKAADKFSIPRISQLTQKTNQFNMTTRRYSEIDIMEFVTSSDSYVFSVSSQDRFGDNGIIGVFVLKFDGDICLIDSFLLSCRVIGRTIEQSIAAFISEFAREKGATTLVGEFIPTAKNQPANDFYKSLNFTDAGNARFILDLQQQRIEYSPYIDLKIIS